MCSRAYYTDKVLLNTSDFSNMSRREVEEVEEVEDFEGDNDHSGKFNELSAN